MGIAVMNFGLKCYCLSYDTIRGVAYQSIYRTGLFKQKGFM